LCVSVCESGRVFVCGGGWPSASCWLP
jgi:hypothetical protein